MTDLFQYQYEVGTESLLETPLRSECYYIYIYVYLNELISEIIIACRYNCRIFNAFNLKY